MSHGLTSWLLAALAVASFVFLAPATAAADLISSAPATPDQAAQVSHADVVADSLRAQGLSETEVSARLAEMSETDLALLAQSPAQMQMAAGLGHVALGIGLAVILGLILYLLD